MEIGKFIEQTGTFLSANEIEQSPTKKFVITKEPQLVTNKFGNDRIHAVGEIDGKVSTFDMSKTNARTMAETCGPETKNWIGATIELETYKTRTSDGKLTTALNIKNIFV